MIWADGHPGRPQADLRVTSAILSQDPPRAAVVQGGARSDTYYTHVGVMYTHTVLCSTYVHRVVVLCTHTRCASMMSTLHRVVISATTAW